VGPSPGGEYPTTFSDYVGRFSVRRYRQGHAVEQGRRRFCAVYGGEQPYDERSRRTGEQARLSQLCHRLREYKINCSFLPKLETDEINGRVGSLSATWVSLRVASRSRSGRRSSATGSASTGGRAKTCRLTTSTRSAKSLRRSLERCRRSTCSVMLCVRFRLFVAGTKWRLYSDCFSLCVTDPKVWIPCLVFRVMIAGFSDEDELGV
jgi:hypothetical protein